jgi:ribulose-5-phosphate 4-epimerase/fuculose-1-phosphate aldolase
MIGEGYIKFNCIRTNEDIFIPSDLFDELTVWRQKMFENGLIGVTPDGIGYGNISVRAAGGGFYISGTATGSLPELAQNHYALVNTWQTEKNALTCTGRINASAESLSHAAIYDSVPGIGAVIHIHNKPMWKKYIHLLPTTPIAAEYGTPEMAGEIAKIVRSLKSGQDAILVMGGHEDGIIVWGKTLAHAGETTLKYFHGF